jgi:hypothetical protein
LYIWSLFDNTVCFTLSINSFTNTATRERRLLTKSKRKVIHHHHHHHPSRVRCYNSVSAWSNCLFKGLSSCLRQFGLQCRNNFCTVFLFVLVLCRSQFDLYLNSFSSNCPIFNSSKMYSFLLWSRREYPSVLVKNSISMSIVFITFSTGPNFVSKKIKWGKPIHYTPLFLKFLDQIWLKSVVFIIPSICSNLDRFAE